MARYRELTYRTEPIDHRLVSDMASRLIGQPVVIWLLKRQTYRRCYLVSIDAKEDRFQVRLGQRGAVRTYSGIWRIHNAKLFGEGVLPSPCFPARIPEVNNHYPGGVTKMAKATTSKTRGKAAPAKSSNGAGERTRAADILEEFTEAERKRLAKSIIKMKKAGAKWGEIGEELGLPGERPSVAGRRLLREYSDDGEDFIREREVVAQTPGKKRTRKVAEVDEDESEEEAPPKRTKRKVAVKRGTGKRANPS